MCIKMHDVVYHIYLPSTHSTLQGRRKLLKFGWAGILNIRLTIHVATPVQSKKGRQAFSLLCQYETGVHKLSLLRFAIQDSRPSKENEYSKTLGCRGSRGH